MYASAQDLRARYPENDLVQLTDPNGVVLNVGKLEGALADASAEIDGYLQARYPLPLPVVPAHLKTLACNIAMYRLQVLRPMDDIEDARLRYTDAVKYLEKVNMGTLQLGVAVNQQAVQQTGGPEIREGDLSFTRGKMQGY